MFIDVSQIANNEILSNVSASLYTCIICTGLVINPKQCFNCENAFCTNCINSWLEYENICPFKCGSGTIKDSSRLLKGILSNLIIICKICNAKITYKEVEKHNCENCISCPLCTNMMDSSILKKNKPDLASRYIDYVQGKKDYVELKEKLIQTEKSFKDKIDEMERQIKTLVDENKKLKIQTRNIPSAINKNNSVVKNTSNQHGSVIIKKDKENGNVRKK